MSKITLTRNQLYEKIWSKPTIAVAKEFGLSDNGLRKICKKFNIPLPYLGYWQKLKHGKPVRKVKLPTNFKGKDEIIINPSNAKSEAIIKETSMRTTLIMEIESKHKHLLVVPLRLTNPDEMIIRAKDALTIHKQYWSNHGLIITKAGLLNIKVAPSNVSRALRIMDSLIKLLKARGFEIKVDYDGSYVVIFEQRLIICLQEKLGFDVIKNDKFGMNTRNYHPSGILTLRIWKKYIWEQKMWSDGKMLLEHQLAKIAAGIELYAWKEKEERLKLEERWRKQEEEQRIAKERHDREALDGANFLKLLAQSNQWKQTQILNEYIAEIENRANLSGGPTDEKKEWLRWAKEKSERYNPLNNL